jgi:hypothetical protein
MGEKCLRWAMRVPADVPLTPDNRPLDVDTAGRLFTHWERLGFVQPTRSFPLIGALLMSLDDTAHCSRLTSSFLAVESGIAKTTVRATRQRFETVGRLLTEATDDERLRMTTPKD